jgi:flagellar motor switch protein FliN/FliY
MCPDEEVNKDDSPKGVAVEEATQASAAGQAGAAPGGAAPAGDEGVGDGGRVAAGDKDSVKKAEFQEIASAPEKGEKPGMELLMDVTLPVSVELGRATMTIQEVLGIYAGSVIELERVAGEPVDILVGGKLLGKGEVVVVDDKFGVRITELINRVEGIEQ